MFLIDTSVWIAHLANGLSLFKDYLDKDLVLCHSFVIGELALGNLKNRKEVLALLSEIPTAKQASQPEVMHLIEKHKLYSKGIGWIDAHLLASAKITNCGLWTLDKPLVSAAKILKIETIEDAK